MSGRSFALPLGKLILLLSVFYVAASTLRALALQNGSSQAQEQSSSDAQSQSIADAARRSREQAKNATKPSKVISDDDLDKKNVKPGAQGLTVDAPAKLETQPATADDVAAAAAARPASADPATVPAVTDDPEMARLKDEIAEAEKDADLLKREFALQQDTYLSNPDHEHDTAGKAKIDALQQQMDAKQQDIDRLKTRLSAMQELQHKPAPATPAKRATPPPAPTPVAPATPSAPVPAQPQA